MEPLVVREAAPADIDALAGVKTTGWRTTYTDLVAAEVLQPFLDRSRQRADFAALLQDADALVLIAETDGCVVGFGVGDTTTGYIDSLHVLPSHRGLRIGRELLVGLATRLRDRGCTELSLHVVDTNSGARRFYERMGGRVAGSAPAAWAPADVEEVHYRWADVGLLIRSH